jgi:hypothetical protein
MQNFVAHKTRVLSVYRALLREGAKLPTRYKRQWVRTKVRSEFRKYMHEKDPVIIEQQVVLAEDSLDNLQVQVEHLNKYIPREPDEVPLPALEKSRKTDDIQKRPENEK